MKEFTAGDVAATVWVNKPIDGELFLKASFRRKEELANGRTAYRSSFFPHDLVDLHKVIVEMATWLRDAGHVLMHGGNGTAGSSKKEPARSK